MFSLIVAADNTNGIGKDGGLPWKLRRDMQYFKELTSGHVVIMGRKTWDSIPEHFRPLSNRVNIIVTRQTKQTLGVPDDVVVVHSLDEALQTTRDGRECFVIGGGSLYAEAITRTDCSRLYLTEIDHTFDCDTFFPNYTPFQETSSSDPIIENNITYRFKIFDKHEPKIE